MLIYTISQFIGLPKLVVGTFVWFSFPVFGAIMGEFFPVASLCDERLMLTLRRAISVEEAFSPIIFLTCNLGISVSSVSLYYK